MAAKYAAINVVTMSGPIVRTFVTPLVMDIWS